LLLKKLIQDQVYRPANGWRPFFFRVTLASLAMAACLYYMVNADWWNYWDSKERAFNLGKWIFIGLAIYLATLRLTGLRLRHLSQTHDKIENF